MTLWLVRHARPLVAPATCYGSLDIPADAQATTQATVALARVLPPGIAIRSSTLQRCEQLAQSLCALQPDFPLKMDARLAEMDFGAWEGRTWDAIGRPAIDAWTADFAQHRPGGGESVAGLLARVGSALEETRAAKADAVWITHAGVIRAVRLHLKGMAIGPRADQWPADAPAFGAWDLVPL